MSVALTKLHFNVFGVCNLLSFYFMIELLAVQCWALVLIIFPFPEWNLVRAPANLRTRHQHTDTELLIQSHHFQYFRKFERGAFNAKLSLILEKVKLHVSSPKSLPVL